MTKVYCDVHNQEYNIDTLNHGEVSYNGKNLYLTAEATADNYGDGVGYFADAIDTDGNCYQVIWETTEEWDLAQEYTGLEVLVKQAERYNESISAEDLKRFNELDKMHLVDVNDESNACDWECPVSIKQY